MKISDNIERFIREMLAEDESIELKRNELANYFKCVPSQINYVISTRFTTERGFSVESRRGGGGYIKITRVTPTPGNRLMHVVNSIGKYLSFTDAVAIIRNCADYDLISQKEAKLIIAAMSEKSIPLKQPEQDLFRANILKNMLITLA